MPSSLTLNAPARAPQPPSHPLDAPAQWQAFSRPLPGRTDAWESWLAIEGMWCPACSLAVEEAIGAAASVESVQVNGATCTARVAWRPAEGLPSQWLAALKRAGYGAVPAADQFDAAPRRRAQRVMLWRWLVAGFCMMQVMMYAYPAYVAAPGEITPDIQSLLRWASWLLTLPVLLFSCRPFFASAWRDLTHGRLGMDVPVSLGILIAFAASSAATFDPQGALGAEVWYDSVTMFVFFLLSGRLLEMRLRERTAGALESLARSLPATAQRVGAHGTLESVPLASLQAGDLVEVRPGEVFPADGDVAEGEGAVDEALLTGESHPLRRRVGDAVVAGSHNLSAVLRVRVRRTGGETRFAQIVALMERASVDKPRLAALADRIAGPFLAGVLLAAFGAAAWWWSQGPGPALGVAVAVLIVTCPCALSLATPAASLAAAGALARRGVLVRSLRALESGAAIDTVVFDKTGTLTEDRLAVVRVQVRPGADEGRVRVLAAALAVHSLHPVSRAVSECAADASSPLTASNVREHRGNGIEGDADGMAVRLGSAAFCGAPAQHADAQAHVSDAQGWLGAFELSEAVRAEAVPALQALRSSGLDIELLSGDRGGAVQRLAARLGIARALGRQSPEDKLARLEALQAQRRRVAMVGDGMNDGPVLARADLSIALGTAVPVAQSKSDVVVPGGQLSAVPLLLAQARRTRSIVRQNLAWSVAYNALGIPLALAGWMPPWLAGLGMAASSLLVVLNSARLARLPVTNS